MGADFLMFRLVWDKDTKINFKKGYKFIDSLEIKDLAQSVLEIGCGETDKENLKQAKDYLADNLRELEVAFTKGRRDADSFEEGNLRFFVTGGMSWGDSPTDLYNNLCNISEQDGLLDSMGFIGCPPDYKALLKKCVKLDGIAPLLLGIDPVIDGMIEKVLKTKKRAR